MRKYQWKTFVYLQINLSKQIFSERWQHDYHMRSLPEFSSNRNPKWPVIFASFDFLGRSVDAKHLMLFQSGNNVFKFLWRSEDETLLVEHDKPHYSVTLIGWFTLVHSNRVKQLRYMRKYQWKTFVHLQINHSKESFWKRWQHHNPEISLLEFSSNRTPKWPLVVAFSNFSGVVSTEKDLRRFQSETPFSNFSGVVWVENIWRVFRVKTPFSNFSGWAYINSEFCFREKYLKLSRVLNRMVKLNERIFKTASS